MTRTVTTTGRAVTISRPDHVVVEFRVDSVEPDKSAALAQMTERAGILDRLIEAASDTIEHRADSPITLGPLYEGRWGERFVVGYRAERTSALRLTTWEHLAELMRVAVEEARATLVGPTWGLKDTNAAFHRSLSQAAADAKNRAAAYCSGLGVTLGAVLDITDPAAGSRGFRDDDGVGQVLFSASSDVSGPDEESERQVLSINPAELNVNATVTVRFALGDAD